MDQLKFHTFPFELCSSKEEMKKKFPKAVAIVSYCETWLVFEQFEDKKKFFDWFRSTKKVS